jgi:uncharacterized protein (DUF433 family)
MSTATQYPHLCTDPSGEVRIEGSRYKVAHLAAEHYHYGWSAEELLRQHSDLRPEQVYAALTYFYDHFGPMTAAMRQSYAEFDSERKSQPLSRDELLARRDQLDSPQ